MFRWLAMATYTFNVSDNAEGEGLVMALLVDEAL